MQANDVGYTLHPGTTNPRMEHFIPKTLLAAPRLARESRRFIL